MRTHTYILLFLHPQINNDMCTDVISSPIYCVPWTEGVTGIQETAPSHRVFLLIGGPTASLQCVYCLCVCVDVRKNLLYMCVNQVQSLQQKIKEKLNKSNFVERHVRSFSGELFPNV